MSTATKVYGVLGLSLFLLGLVFVCLHLVKYSGQASLPGLIGVWMQAVGAAFIIGTLIRAAGGR